ncbi:MAG TPA: hypothetical protein VJN02_08985 [Gammaproteobacteria bacterium]|nr:hypothetical protein [Gammaproteobacteria bacterium]
MRAIAIGRLRKRDKGISLLEVVLVLVIGTVFVTMGLRQYQIFRADADIQQVKYNVDTLFQAAARFYQVNCNLAIDSGGTLTYGKLNPMATVTPPNPYPAYTYSTDSGVLRSDSFLTVNLPLSPIVSDYKVQFIRNDTTRTLDNIPIGTIVIWRIQVIVTLRDPSEASPYLRLFKADCLTNSTAPSSSCGDASMAAGDYVVFERLPSFASAQHETTYWVVNPRAKQFNQLYTTYSTQHLMNTGGGIPGGNQYFLCGG